MFQHNPQRTRIKCTLPGLLVLWMACDPATSATTPDIVIKDQRKHQIVVKADKQVQKQTTKKSLKPSIATFSPRPLQTKATQDKQCAANTRIVPALKPGDQLSPKLNPKHEAALIINGTAPLIDYSSGKWTLADGLKPQQGATNNAIMMFKQGSHQDAMIRAQFELKDTLDWTILFRATATNKNILGYGLKLHQNTAQLVRFDGKKTTELDSKEIIYRLKKRPALEVIIYTLGTNIFAQIHDAKTGVELLNLHAKDTTYTRGTTGIFVPANHTNPPQNALANLRLRTACQHLPKRPSRVKKPPRRYVTINANQRLPKAMTRGFQKLETIGAYTTYKTDAIGLEQLHCHPSIPIKNVSVEIPWKFIDRDYLHYKSKPPVQDRSGLRVDLSFKNPTMVQELLHHFHKKYPTSTRLVTIGHTRQNRPIMAMAVAHNIKKDDSRPALLLNGAHHGDEPLSTDITFDALKYVLSSKEKYIKKARRSYVIWFIPQVNPDGATAFLEHTWRTGRKNGRDLDRDGQRDRFEGVDLNRNYPFMWGKLDDKGSSPEPKNSRYRGDKPASEPETQAMMALFERERFIASISYHTGTVCLLAAYTIDGIQDAQPNEVWAIAKAITNKMPTHPEGRPYRLKRNLYPVSGTDQDWFRHKYGTVALLVEAVRTTPRNTCDRRIATHANRKSWQTLIERTVHGPVLIGNTLDAQTKQPVEAIITIKEQTLNANEVWTSRPRDGLFGRYLIKSGRYTITASAKGYLPTTQTIKVHSTAKITMYLKPIKKRAP